MSFGHISVELSTDFLCFFAKSRFMEQEFFFFFSFWVEFLLVLPRPSMYNMLHELNGKQEVVEGVF